MKRIIAGRIYDTDTARLIASTREVSDEGPTYYVSYYRTRSGMFFAHEECGRNERIEPVSEETMKEFCSAHPECIDDEMDKDIIRKAMAVLGRVKSEKKAAASRENGKKGGRPSHKKTYRVVVRQIGAEYEIEARDPMKAANAACSLLAPTLPAEYTSSNPLTVRCIDDVGNVLAARNLWHRCPDGAVRNRPTQEFRS